ncbi:MAG: hypothetical protein ABIH20_04175 [Candidatus Diapherotrites archaeon]
MPHESPHKPKNSVRRTSITHKQLYVELSGHLKNALKRRSILSDDVRRKPMNKKLCELAKTSLYMYPYKKDAVEAAFDKLFPSGTIVVFPSKTVEGFRLGVVKSDKTFEPLFSNVGVTTNWVKLSDEEKSKKRMNISLGGFQKKEFYPAAVRTRSGWAWRLLPE